MSAGEFSRANELAATGHQCVAGAYLTRAEAASNCRKCGHLGLFLELHQTSDPRNGSRAHGSVSELPTTREQLGKALNDILNQRHEHARRRRDPLFLEPYCRGMGYSSR